MHESDHLQALVESPVKDLRQKACQPLLEICEIHGSQKPRATCTEVCAFAVAIVLQRLASCGNGKVRCMGGSAVCVMNCSVASFIHNTRIQTRMDLYRRTGIKLWVSVENVHLEE